MLKPKRDDCMTTVTLHTVEGCSDHYPTILWRFPFKTELIWDTFCLAGCEEIPHPTRPLPAGSCHVFPVSSLIFMHGRSSFNCTLKDCLCSLSVPSVAAVMGQLVCVYVCVRVHTSARVCLCRCVWGGLHLSSCSTDLHCSLYSFHSSHG